MQSEGINDGKRRDGYKRNKFIAGKKEIGIGKGAPWITPPAIVVEALSSGSTVSPYLFTSPDLGHQSLSSFLAVQRSEGGFGESPPPRMTLRTTLLYAPASPLAECGWWPALAVRIERCGGRVLAVDGVSGGGGSLSERCKLVIFGNFLFPPGPRRTHAGYTASRWTRVTHRHIAVDSRPQKGEALKSDLSHLCSSVLQLLQLAESHALSYLSPSLCLCLSVPLPPLH